MHSDGIELIEKKLRAIIRRPKQAQYAYGNRKMLCIRIWIWVDFDACIASESFRNGEKKCFDPYLMQQNFYFGQKLFGPASEIRIRWKCERTEKLIRPPPTRVRKKKKVLMILHNCHRTLYYTHSLEFLQFGASFESWGHCLEVFLWLRFLRSSTIFIFFPILTWITLYLSFWTVAMPPHPLEHHNYYQLQCC